MKENVGHLRHHNNTIFPGSTNCIILTPTPAVRDKTGGLGTIVRSSHIGGAVAHSNRVIRPIGWSSVWTMGEQLPPTWQGQISEKLRISSCYIKLCSAVFALGQHRSRNICHFGQKMNWSHTICRKTTRLKWQCQCDWQNSSVGSITRATNTSDII